MKALLVAAVASVVAALVAAAAPAATETSTFVIEFSAVHPCTGEPVEGDTRVHVVVTTTENPDGTTRVRTLQQTHGHSLVGLISGDRYNFNNGQDVVEEFDLLGSSGRIVTRTEFIHQGEDLAFEESAGLDDLHERIVLTFRPLLPPTVERERVDCR